MKQGELRYMKFLLTVNPCIFFLFIAYQLNGSLRYMGFFYFYLKILKRFWLCGVLVAVQAFLQFGQGKGQGSSLVAVLMVVIALASFLEQQFQGAKASIVAPGFQGTGSIIVTCGLSCSACGIFPDLGLNPCILHWHDFPGGSDGKASAYNAGDPGSIPGLGSSPGEGNGNPLQYSCLENPMDRGTWQATVSGVTKSQTRLSDFISFSSCIGRQILYH